MSNRAASGESSIYKDEAGRWHGYVSMGLKENGRRDRRHVSGTRRADVVAKVRALEAKRDAGTAEAAGRAPTVGDWLEHIASRRVRARTLESYEALVRLHLRPGIGHHRLDRLQPEHLEQLYGSLLEDKGLSPATVLRLHRVLSRALRVAMQRGKIARIVATLVDPPAVKRPTTALPLTVDEARRVLQAAEQARNSARWTVALAVGLRQSETLGLRWSDIDLDVGTLTVRRGLHRVAGKGLVYEEPKAERSRRTLALPAPLVTVLRRHRGVQLEERQAAGSLWEEHDLVFAQVERTAAGQAVGLGGVEGAADACRGARGAAARRPPHGSHAAAVGRRPPTRRHGAARARADAHHHGHLQPRDAGAGQGSRRQDGRGAVGMSGTTWHQWPPRWHHERLWAPSSEGERPGHHGWS